MSSKMPPEPTFLAAFAPPANDGPDPLRALARAAAAGQREAMVRLMSLVAPPVAAAVRALLGPGHRELEDAVQEALLAITSALDRFRGDSSFLHYARRIAVRTALAQRRAEARGTRRLAEALASEAPAAGDASVAPSIEREQRVALLARLLDELPEGQAECLAYRVLLELPLPQIAREIGVPINTVRSRVRLARNHLRDRILGDPALAESLGLEE
ncbi:MAG TPA: sigma-70 family RNA polymerase sigma factor [Polyangia bacterium]|nr:sigma-70 family RNA polymerase sigma factor [Polyangia bacterium]